MVPICGYERVVERAAPSDVRQTPHKPLHPSEKNRSRYIRVNTPSWLQNARWMRMTVSSLALSGFILCFNQALLDAGAIAAHSGHAANLHADYMGLDTPKHRNTVRSLKLYPKARGPPFFLTLSSLRSVCKQDAQCRMQAAGVAPIDEPTLARALTHRRPERVLQAMHASRYGS